MHEDTINGTHFTLPGPCTNPKYSFFTGLVPNQDECKPIIAIYDCAGTSSGSVIVLFLKITRLTDNYNQHYTTFTICMTANDFQVFKYKAMKGLSVFMMEYCLMKCTDAVTLN